MHYRSNITTITSKLKIGCHLSCAKGYADMGRQALELGANVFQFFSRTPRGSKAKSVSEKDISALLKIISDNHFGKLLVHAPYTLNICSYVPEIAEISLRIVYEDIATLEKYLPGHLYNIHPGCRKNRSVSEAIKTASTLLNQVITENQSTIILLETMSGKGSEIGATFEELNSIISEINFPQKIGVCLDTCHIFSAGYDMINSLDSVLEDFDRIIGLHKLYAIHLNDSMMPFASHKDRHAPLGKGEIGLKALTDFINHPKIKYLPFYLETPDNENAHMEEIKLIKSLYHPKS